MTSFWDSIGRSFGRFIGAPISESEDDYLATSPGGKRKISGLPRSVRRSTARRNPVVSTSTTLAEEEGETRSSYAGDKRRRLSDVPEEESPKVTGFVKHRNSIERRPPLRRLKSPEKGPGDGFRVLKTRPRATRAATEEPAPTEGDMQADLLAEWPDEEVEARYTAEFQESEYDDKELSEGEQGRRYFMPAPWAKNRAEWDRMMNGGAPTSPK